jgi:16S rRNA (uracil1498-N3)-methyltransferase
VSPYNPLTHPTPLVVGETYTLNTQVTAGIHFRKVNPKEAFTLGDSTGKYFRASLVTLEKESATALVYEAMPDVPESPIEITLVCAVLQRQRMLWVCQKAAELGVTRIQPVITLKSVQADGLAHEKAHAWPAQALKGARQCRRASLPEVMRAQTLEQCVTSDVWKTAHARTFLDDQSEGEALPGGCKNMMLVIGPEGGFANVERQLLVNAKAVPLKLGGRVLRAETAVLVGITVVQHCLGDMGIERRP